MKVYLPWSDDNPNKDDWFDNDDLDLEEPSEEKPIVQPVPASEDPNNEELLSIPQIVDLAAGLASEWRIRKAVLSGVFPSAKKQAIRPGRGAIRWTIPRSEVESWLERLSDG